MTRTVALRATAVALLLCSAGCTGAGPTAAEVKSRITSEPTAASALQPDGSARVDAAFVTYSESTNRLTYLSRALTPTGLSTQLASTPSDVVSAGGAVVVGYGEGSIATVDPRTGNQTRTGHVDPAALGEDVQQLLVDQLLGSAGTVLVAGRFATTDRSVFHGYVQQLDAGTLRPRRTWVFRDRVVQDLQLDGHGRPQLLFDDGSFGDLLAGQVRIGTPGARPSFFAPRDASAAATVTRGAKPFVTTPAGRRVDLAGDAGPRSIHLLPGGAVAVLLSDAGQVLFLEPSGRSSVVAVPDLPYAALVDARRLLVVEANGSELVAISLRSHTVERRVRLDRNVERIVRLS